MIKAVFFDSGNVLVKEGFRSGIVAMERKYHFSVGSLYSSAHDHKYWEDFTLGKITERQYLERVRQNFGPDLDISEFRRVILRSFAPNQPLLRFAKSLQKKYILGIISNNPKEWFDYFCRRYGWNKVFSVRAVSSYLHVRKPDPRIFCYALKKAGVSPPEALYVDDRVEKATGAKRLGIKAIIYRSLKEFKNNLRKELI